MPGPLLEVRDLGVSFRTEAGLVRAVDRVSFVLHPGEVLGIVGESGSGKSVTAMSILRLIRDPNAVFTGQALFEGQDLMSLAPREMRKVRGAKIAMIFQDPMSSLNPVYRVGWQIAEQVREHEQSSRQEARRRAVELLGEVGIPNARSRVDDYPHQFSGGMRQRVMIAMALSCHPDLVIADEPTTALDVTIQAQILALLRRLRDDFGSTVVLITHDMGVLADIADRMLVMYAGRIVEQGAKRAVFADPQHPYAWGLLGATPRLDRPKPRRLLAIPGAPPSLIDLPAGCHFRPRCDYAFDRCVEDPALTDKVGESHLDESHLDACHLPVPDKRRLSPHSSYAVPGGADD